MVTAVLDQSWQKQLDEAQTLSQLEKLIEKHMQAAWVIALALAKIKDNGLYKSRYGTWGNYCQDRWNRTSTWGDGLIRVCNPDRLEDCSGEPRKERTSRNTGSAGGAGASEETDGPWEADGDDEEESPSGESEQEEGGWDDLVLEGSLASEYDRVDPRDGDPKEAMKALGKLRRFAAAVSFYARWEPVFDELEKFVKGYSG